MSDSETNNLDFLIQAANFAGGPHSKAAREAVELVAERLRLLAESELTQTREQLEALGATAAE